MTDQSISKARAFVVVKRDTRERVSHELPTYEEGEQFIAQISLAEGDEFDIVPLK